MNKWHPTYNDKDKTRFYIAWGADFDNCDHILNNRGYSTKAEAEIAADNCRMAEDEGRCYTVATLDANGYVCPLD